MLVIGATPFMIDNVLQLLRQFNKRENVITYDELKREDGYYIAEFNRNHNKVSAEWRGPGENREHILNVFIPAPVIDAPGSITEDFRNELNILSQDKDWGIYLADHDTAMRLSGKLPHIDLAGTDFTVDWRLKELRETERPWKNFSLKDMEISDNGEEYLCFYNTETHELFEADEKLYEMPKNVVVLEIPNELKLDPVAVAGEYGIGATDLLIEYPFQMSLTAKATPLAETGLSKFIEENIRRRDNDFSGHNATPKRGR